MLKLQVLFISLLFCTEIQCRETLSRPETAREKESIQTQIERGITEIFKKIEAPTSQTSISEPVCKRPFSTTAQTKAIELKSIIQSNKQSQRCGTPTTTTATIRTIGTPRTLPTFPTIPNPGGLQPFGKERPGFKPASHQDHLVHPRKRRHTSFCNLGKMSYDEKEARKDLHPTGININRICVRQVNCVKAGSTDPNTGTINMCNTCKYFVYLPWE